MILSFTYLHRHLDFLKITLFLRISAVYNDIRFIYTHKFSYDLIKFPFQDISMLHITLRRGEKKKTKFFTAIHQKKKKQSVKRHHRARFSSVFSRIPIIISHHPLSTKRYFLVTVHEPCDLSPSQARFSSDVDPSRSFDLPRLDRIDDHIAKNKTARLGVQLSKPGSNTLTFTFSRGCNEEKGREKKNVDGVGIRTRSNDPGENVRSPLRRCHTAVDVVVVVVIDCTQVTGGSNVSRAYMESVSPGTRLRIA